MSAARHRRTSTPLRDTGSPPDEPSVSLSEGRLGLTAPGARARTLQRVGHRSATGYDSGRAWGDGSGRSSRRGRGRTNPLDGVPARGGLPMIIPLEPRLEGLAERRFFSFARQMLDRQAHDPGRIGNLVKDETTRVSGLDDLRGQHDEYTACVRVLGDLAQLRWTLVENGYGLELHSPRPRTSGSPAPPRRAGARTPSATSCARGFCNSSRTRTCASSSTGWSAPLRPPGGSRSAP